MKKNITLLFVLLSFVSFSQTIESLKVDTKKMYEASYNMAFDEVINYTHPKVFEIATREQMLDLMTNTFDNDNFKVRIVLPNPTFTYSDIKKIDGKTLCIINYTNSMRMTFVEKLTPEMVEMMTKSFKESGEYSTIKYESDRNSIYIDGKATMIAVSEEATKNEWKFVNYSLSQAEMAKQILGENVLKALGF